MGISLSDLGFEAFYSVADLKDQIYARVIMEHRDRYIVLNETGQYEAEISGSLRFMATSRSDFPAVGDWVLISAFDDGEAVIQKILPRKTILERRVVDGKSDKQLLGTNIDCAFIMQALDRDFNLHRLERYVSLVDAGRIEPVVLLSKSDLIDHLELREITEMVQNRLKMADVIYFSNVTEYGLMTIQETIRPGKTYCVLGSSGVGKSTLINKLAGQTLLKASALSESTGKGRHTTSHRELIVLKNGGLLIDSPGMREVGVTDISHSLAGMYRKLEELASQCRFNDCTHTSEPGCAVQEAIRQGDLDEDVLESYKKLSREASRFQMSVLEKRKKDKKTGRLYKQILKEKKNRKF